MSGIKELYDKVAEDSGLQTRFKVIMAAAEKEGMEATEAKLTTFAKAAGYDVTLEDMRAFFNELAQQKEGGLSESELDMVAGGKSTGQILFSVGTAAYGCGQSSVVKRGDEIICKDPGSEFGL